MSNGIATERLQDTGFGQRNKDVLTEDFRACFEIIAAYFNQKDILHTKKTSTLSIYEKDERHADLTTKLNGPSKNTSRNR